MADRDIVRALCLRQPGSRYRFTLRMTPEPALDITPLRTEPATPPADGLSGIVLVDADLHPVFCAATAGPRLLADLAAWTKRPGASVPAAAAIRRAGAARWEGDPADAAAAALNLDNLDIYRDDALWNGAVRADAAETSRVLEASMPGERLWFWLTEAPGSFGMPLLLQAVGEDPNRDGLNALIDFVEPGGPGPAVTGFAYTGQDGVLQFVGPGLTRPHLEAIAAWVRANVADHPGLARLGGCCLAPTQDGRVAALIEDAGLWTGVPRPAVPGTAAAAEAALLGLKPDEDCWAWVIATGSGAFLSVSPVKGDAKGEAFKARLPGFQRRFEAAQGDGLTGVLRRLASGGLQLVTRQDASAWPDLRDRLAESHPAAADLLRACELRAPGG